MSDSRLNGRERRWQPPFSKLLFLLIILLLGRDSRDEGPNRSPRPERLAALRLQPVDLGPVRTPGVRLTGAWRAEADDPRLAGLSGLAVREEGGLLALTDSGVLVDLPKPEVRRPARFRDLATGPGYPTFRKYRDSEALLLLSEAKAPGTTTVVVSFEHRHSLYWYREDGQLGSLRLPRLRWPSNKGAEALTHDGRGNLLVIGEQGRDILLGRPGRLVRRPLKGATGGVADAVRLPDGRWVVAVREFGLSGLTNRLAWLTRDSSGYRLNNFATLPLGSLDNVEGLAAEPGPGGSTILWAVTDNDGWRRTLLLRLVLDTTKAPANAGA